MKRWHYLYRHSKTVVYSVFLGMASLGGIYMSPILPTKYPHPYDIDQKSIGRDMWKAIDTYNNETF